MISSLVETQAKGEAIQYQVWEKVFLPTAVMSEPFINGSLRVEITDPYGDIRSRDGFWDGGVWRLRWMPLEEGPHHFRIETNLDGLPESFGVVAGPSPVSISRRHALSESGPVRIADDRFRFARHDGTPLFLSCDDIDVLPGTSSDAEWAEYALRRRVQGFASVAFATEPLEPASEDRFGRRLYDPLTGATDLAALADADRRIAALNAAGLVAMPVLFSRSQLWSEALADEGIDHPWKHTVDSAIRIGRHLVARWGAYDVMWRLDLAANRDDPTPMVEDAVRVGREIFGEDHWRAPVGVTIRGRDHLHDALRNEPWIGWLAVDGSGPDHSSGSSAAQDAKRPLLGVVRYNHPEETDLLRSEMYSAVFAAPPAGIGVRMEEIWPLREEGWAGGSEIPNDSERWDQTGRDGLANLVGHLPSKISRHHWSDLSPAPEFAPFAALANSDRSMIRVYLPQGGDISLPGLRRIYAGYWTNPRLDAEDVEIGEVTAESVLTAPSEEDWILELDAADGF